MGFSNKVRKPLILFWGSHCLPGSARDDSPATERTKGAAASGWDPSRPDPQ